MKSTKKQDSLKAIVAEIKSAAALYKKYLVGKKFMYVFDNRYIEVIYKAQNFKHLTGVETHLSAKRFYHAAISNQLQMNQIWFTKEHPYDLCIRKIRHLHDLVDLAASESFILEEIKTNTQAYKFSTTNLDFTLCMNRETDASGKETSECYIVQSLRDEDCTKKAKEVYEVTHILSKPNDAPQYTDIIWLDKKHSIDTLPSEVASMVQIYSSRPTF